MRVNNLIPSSKFSYSSALSPMDCVWAALAPYAAFGLRDPNVLVDPSRIDTIVLFAIAAFFATLLVMAVFRLGEGLTRFFSFADLVPVVQAAIGSSALAGASLFILMRLDDVPRSILPLHALLLAVGWLGGRFASRAMARRKAMRHQIGMAAAGGSQTNAVIVGVNTTAWLYLKVIEENAGALIRVLGFLDSRQKFTGRSVSGYPVVGQPQRIEQVIEEYAVHGIHIDRVIVAAPRARLSALEAAAISGAEKRLGLKVEFLEEMLGLASKDAGARRTGGAEIVTLPLTGRGQQAGGPAGTRASTMPSGPYWAAKRLLDILGAAAHRSLGVHMRVPTRENRFFVAPSPVERRDLRRESRLPQLATPRARNTVYQLLAEAYRDVRRNDRFADAPVSDVLPEAMSPDTEQRGQTRRMSALLQEMRWSRILRNHNLDERD